MKYVMIRKGERVFPVIFPDFMVHEDVANAIIAVELNCKAVFAGDCSVREVICSGRSQTLEMVSRGEVDEQVILMGQYSAYWEGEEDQPPIAAK